MIDNSSLVIIHSQKLHFPNQIGSSFMDGKTLYKLF